MGTDLVTELETLNRNTDIEWLISAYIALDKVSNPIGRQLACKTAFLNLIERVSITDLIICWQILYDKIQENPNNPYSSEWGKMCEWTEYYIHQ